MTCPHQGPLFYPEGQWSAVGVLPVSDLEDWPEISNHIIFIISTGKSQVRYDCHPK